MNIFLLDLDPELCAAYHNDRHIAQMSLEYTQMLCGAHYFLDGKVSALARLGRNMPALSSVSHPCSTWARATTGNYDWLYSLLGHVLGHYAARNGRAHPMAASGLYANLVARPLNLSVGGWRTPPMIVPVQYRRHDPVFSYRLYYYNEKQKIAQWSPPSAMPHWWRDGMEFIRRTEIANG